MPAKAVYCNSTRKPMYPEGVSPVGNVAVVTLPEHETQSQKRYESLHEAITKGKKDITSQTLQQTIGLTNQIDDAKAAVYNTSAQNALLATNGFANLGDKVDSLSTATALGFGVVNSNIERTGWQLSQAINNDGDKTRALIQSIDKTNDSRLITAQANEIAELRNEQRRAADNNGIRIEMINNQNQLQLAHKLQTL